MARPALLPVALTVLLVLAGCSTAIPGTDTATPADVDPRIVGSVSSGGQCVDDPTRGLVVESNTSGGVRTIHVAGNVTVPGAHYVLDETALTRTGPGAYRLDVNTTESTEKPAKHCPNGGIVHYEVTAEAPATTEFELVVRHDGQAVSAVGSGSGTAPDS